VETVKALSLWQPHAIAIGLGLKPFETRGWSTNYRGQLAIHAAKKKFRQIDYPWDYFKQVKVRLQAKEQALWALDYGKIICVCDLVDCTPVTNLRGRIGDAEFWGDFSDNGDDGKWRYAFKLENVRLIAVETRPLVVGRQGFFNVPDELLPEERRGR
jgi:hypothetical protein